VKATTFDELRHEMTRKMKYHAPGGLSDHGVRVAALLDQWHGLHHFEENALKKAEWLDSNMIELRLDRAYSVAQLDTWDFDGLTRLVFLAHDHCIRVGIRPCNPQKVKVIFYPRAGRGEGMSLNHPRLEQAVERWRANQPIAPDWIIQPQE